MLFVNTWLNNNVAPVQQAHSISFFCHIIGWALGVSVNTNIQVVENRSFELTQVHGWASESKLVDDSFWAEDVVEDLAI